MRLAAPVAWVATAAAALFLVYFGRTVCRQLTHIELDETGIRVMGPAVGLLSAAIRWADLCSLRLDYYSTRRDGEGGWMQLRLGDARHTIRIDSELDGFAELVGAAARAAARRDLALDAAHGGQPEGAAAVMADVLQIRDLRVYLEVDAGTVKAVDGVSFRIPEGGTVALVGESGSGKSMVAQAVMSILPRVARIESGEILFHDPKVPGSVIDIARLDPEGERVRAIRGGRISIIFQEPMTALSPLHTVGNQIGEALMLHRSSLGRPSGARRCSKCCAWSASPIR